VASTVLQPVVGVYGQIPQRGLGRAPDQRTGGKAPLKLKHFWLLDEVTNLPTFLKFGNRKIFVK